VNDPFDHQVTTTSEKRGQGANAQTRYRGRCSCGHTTYMHYSTPEAARTAVRRTHLQEVAV
jgi:hypothetical protein